MKNMPGMDNIQSMLSKMGINNLGGLAGLSGLGGKLNTGAMEAQLNQKMKMAKTKERIRAKAEANQKARMEQSQKLAENLNKQPTVSEEEILKIFSTGEKVEKTPRGANPNQNTNNGKKKKGKK